MANVYKIHQVLLNWASMQSSSHLEITVGSSVGIWQIWKASLEMLPKLALMRSTEVNELFATQSGHIDRSMHVNCVLLPACAFLTIKHVRI